MPNSPEKVPLRVYSAESPLRHPRQFLRQMGQDFRRATMLGQRLFLRNIRARYRRSLLGYLWVVLPIIATTLLWTYLQRAQIITMGAFTIPYPLYVLTGTLLWRTFTDALFSPLTNLNAARSLIAKLSFPHEALFLAGLGEVAVNFLARSLVWGIVFVGYGAEFRPIMLAALSGIAALTLLGLTIGLLITPFSMLYGDVERIMRLGVTFWFFMTPIVYAVPTTGTAAFVSALNPVTPLLITTRYWLLGGQLTVAYSTLWGIIGFTLLLFGASLIFNRVAAPHFAQRLAQRG